MDWTNERDNLQKLLSQGISYAEIGRQYGCTGNNVKKQAKKMGLYKPKERTEPILNSRGKLVKPSQYSECPICHRRKWPTSLLCRDCSNKNKRTIGDKTLGDYINGNTIYKTRFCQDIRKDARRVLQEAGIEPTCKYCNSHEFDDIVEVHHIKNILSYSTDTKICDINCKDNLVWLCPNHHTMIERGLITLE